MMMVVLSTWASEYVAWFLSLIRLTFVLLSGEDLEGGILKSYILEADEALVLLAVDNLDDSSIKSM